ncbi:hypothetical protein LZC95_22215 [Pendulispora brunnea]|uniref:Uncharacterized protein n=1 Tax=Pendulispora brunnea TaxID=2905690 RepID=A0ABZ2KPM0_9BACT
MRASTVFRRWTALFGLTALTAACGSLFGVDFDDARRADAYGPDAPFGNGGNGGDGGVDASDGDNGPQPPGPDGGCASADRVLCNGSCVRRNDPAYGCGSCTACPLPSGAVATTCGISSCSFTCPSGKKPQGSACVAKTWTGKKVTPQAIMGIWGTGKNDIYTVGLGGIYHFDGSGEWKPQSSQPKAGKAKGASLMGPSPQSIIAIGGGAPYLMTSPEHWTPWNELGSCADAQAVWANGLDDIYAVGTNAICHSKNRGPFTTKFQPPDTMSAVWGSSTGTIYAVGSGNTAPGIIYASTGDDVWKQVGNTHAALYGIWGTGDDIYAVGATMILRKHGTGEFVQQDTPTGGTYYGVWGSGPDDLYIVGSRGRILHSSNGSVWTEESPSADAVDFYAVWGTGPDDVYAAGATSDGGWIFHLE